MNNQEYLNNLVKNSCPSGTYCKACDFEKSCNSNAKSWIDKMQELVDKATSKKPKIIEWEKIVVCPNCHETLVVSTKHCPDCGQALDWGEE